MYLKKLIDAQQTVFTVDDLQQVWQIENRDYLKTVISRLFKSGKIIRAKRGIYALNERFDIYELANKIKQPSYVSLETVLQKENIIFQDYGQTVFSVANNSVEITIGEKTFKYSKISDDVLYAPVGIINGIASKERAIADRVYLTPDYFFDNLRTVDVRKLKAISKLYNKRTQEEIKKIIKFIKTNYA